MFLQSHLNIDSIRVVQDSIKASSQDTVLMNSLGFNVSNVGTSEVVLTVLGYGIVFLALLTLYLFFANLTKLLLAIRRKKNKASGKQLAENDDSISGEVVAAISMALALNFQEAHDIENTIITIKKVQSTYSPWNSKLHGLRQNPKY
ncbi:MAG: OadG family protein [Melioribacteraceae bacterium]|nr:OadG family protein [Melioribacteraceae bacterium]